MNPGGSVKDRAALGLVEWAEKTGSSSFSYFSFSSFAHPTASSLEYILAALSNARD
jgi:cysteine synthase